MLEKLKASFGGNRLRPLGLVVPAVLIAAGISLITIGALAQKNPPQPGPSTYGSLNMAGQHGQQPTSPMLAYSRPTRLIIPAININASLIEVGKNPNGTIQVPSGATINHPAWYKYSPAPGEYGASVIEGHLDTKYSSESIFFNLGKLKPGDKIMVQRADNILATFTINTVRQFKKSTFPTGEFYKSVGNDAELHLITCGGTFDYTTGSYLANTVVFSTLTNYSKP